MSSLCTGSAWNFNSLYVDLESPNNILDFCAIYMECYASSWGTSRYCHALYLPLCGGEFFMYTLDVLLIK